MAVSPRTSNSVRPDTDNLIQELQEAVTTRRLSCVKKQRENFGNEEVLKTCNTHTACVTLHWEICAVGVAQFFLEEGARSAALEIGFELNQQDDSLSLDPFTYKRLHKESMSELSIVHKRAIKNICLFYDRSMDDLVAVHLSGNNLVRRKMLKDGCGRRRTSCKRNCNTKEGRQARLFTAVNQLSSSILTPHAEVGQPRMPLYASKWRRAHNASYWSDHKLAQDNGRAFWKIY